MEEGTTVGELTSFDVLWAMPIEQCARTIVGEASLGDPRHQEVRAAMLQARVGMEIARHQDETTRELVQATQGLVTRTQNLVKATIAVAMVTAAAIVVGVITALVK